MRIKMMMRDEGKKGAGKLGAEKRGDVGGRQGRSTGQRCQNKGRGDREGREGEGRCQGVLRQQ